MDDLTQAEIDNIVATTFDDSDREFCIMLCSFMKGYLKNPPIIEGEGIESTRQYFFKQIKTHLLGKRKVFRDYEPEQAHGTAIDFQEHQRFGGTKEDY